MRLKCAARRRGPVFAVVLSALLLGFILAAYGPVPAALGLLLTLVGGFIGVRPNRALLVSVVIILLIPYTQHLYHPAVTPPRLAAVIGAGVLLARPRTVRLSLVDLAALAGVLAAVALWRSDIGVGVLLFTLLPLAFYAWGRLGVDAQAVWSLFWVLAFVGVLGALTVLAEYFFVQRTLFYDAQTYDYAASGSETIFRPAGPYGSPPTASVVLGMTALTTTTLVLMSRGWRRCVLAFGVLTMLAGIVVTFGRAGWAGVIIGGLAYISLLRPSALTRRRILAVTLVLATLMIVIVIPVTMTTEVGELGVVRASTVTGRLDVWGLTLPLISDSGRSFVFGHGTGLFASYNAMEGARLDPVVASASILLAKGGPHNDYLLVQVERGLLGLSALLIWLGASVSIGVKKALSTRGPPRLFFAGPVAAVICYSVGGLAHDLSHATQAYALAAMLIGVLVALPVSELVALRSSPGSERPPTSNGLASGSSA